MNDILVNKEDGILTFTFNRTSKKNSITAEMFNILTKEVREAESDESIRIIIFLGTTDAFTAGNDLGDFLENPPNRKDSPVWEFMRSLVDFPKPILAAVSGAAAGIGTTLLLHCDLAYASHTAKFILPFIDLGLCPEAGSSFLLSRIVGHLKASELLMFGQPFGAQEALKIGLINEIKDPEELNSYVLERAKLLLDKPMASLIATKRLMKKNTLSDIGQSIEEERETFTELLSGPDLKEAVTAFGEKRRPVFNKN